MTLKLAISPGIISLGMTLILCQFILEVLEITWRTVARFD